MTEKQPLILTIDDEEAIRSSFKEHLEDYNYDVIEAENGKKGIEAFRQYHPDLILVDLRMPEVDGLEVLEIVTKESPDTPIIVVSGTGVITDAIEALHRGAWDYLLKPVKELDELIHVIENNLEKSRLIIENRRYQDHLELIVSQKTEELKRSNEKLDSIIKTVPDIIYRLDSDGMITFLSDSVRNYGYEPDELIGTSIFSIVHPKYIHRVQHRINERRTGDRKTRELEVVILTKNMNYVPFEVKYRDLLFSNVFEVEAEGLYDQNGIKFQYIGTQGILRDISQRKEAEKKIKESEKRFRTLAEYAPDMIQIWNSEGKITQVNKITCQKLEYHEEELLNANIDAICPELKNKISNSHIWDFEPGTDSLTFTTSLITKNSEAIPVELKIGPIELDEKKYIIGFGRDISERMENERKNIELEKQLRQAQKMEAIGTLAGGIAHDFNNMLTPILGYSDLLKNEFEEGSFAYKGLLEVQHAASRAADLVKQILTFSRQKEKKRESLYLYTIMKEAVKLLRGSIPPNVEIRTIIDENCRPISADPTQMHQIIMNICTNAYQALDGKDGLIEIKLEEITIKEEKIDNFYRIKSDSYNKIMFSDNGCGMDAKTQEHIFEPYFTTKEKGKGTGLGLATVHGIVKNHGGYIFCESQVGVGTTFTIFLPVTEAMETEKSEPKIDKLDVYGNERVLIVDDETNVLRMLESGLQILGYKITPFAKSTTAFNSFKNAPHDYDILILDQIMPGMTGIEMARKVKEIRSDIPIIMHTGFSEAMNEKDRGLISAFFMKPVRIQEIAKSIREIID
ncbi:MAG: response regulator [Candidatus Marinimicrobia bacterium]|nr:response regulator [Candidatus Neomarinimicrobiota bacterium]